VKIYAFIGPSGTGKSHRSQWVARENGIECIIDDGLLIRESKVLAGFSAKKEPSKIASVKRALFLDTNHSSVVKNAIERYDVKSILILGTSDGMVEKIVENLGLPEIEKRIYIQDVATEEEIEYARKVRTEQGKHVIPVPTVEIKEQFSGFFLNPLRIFKKKGQTIQRITTDKSIVRPTFSYMGRYTIAENVIHSMVEHLANSSEGIYKTIKVRSHTTEAGVRISVDVMVEYKENIKGTLEKLAIKINEDISRMTALNIIELNVTAKGIFIDMN